MNTVECPYCGHENDMSDGLVDLPSDNAFDHECDNCEKEFEVLVEFNPSFSASKITYEKCDLCETSTRDHNKKGKTFPFPEEYNVLCNRCFYNKLATGFLDELIK